MKLYTTLTLISLGFGIFLFVGFLVIGLLYRTQYVAFPGTLNKCPDRWQISGNGCVVPKQGDNTGYLYSDPTYLSQYTNNSQQIIIPFNDIPHWDICMKKQWCDKYNINWDTVRNTNQCT